MKFIKETIFTQRDLLTFLTIPLVLWLAMFPEFSITADCCRIVNEDGEVVEWEMSDRELAKEVLEAEDGEVVIKSKLWEMIQNWNKESDDKKSTN